MGDLYAKRNQLTLAEAWGGKAVKIGVGVSIGIQENEADLVELVHIYVEKGINASSANYGTISQTSR